jgi:glycosyltransferase involved in cell wall biosynthesis
MKNQPPTFSYIIPSFNPGKYLDESVASCLAQIQVELEVVVVDDGSTDGSADRIHSKFGKDSRLKILRQANKGESEAINAGFAVSSGRFVCVLSADDLVAPEHAQEMLRAMALSGADVAYPDWQLIDAGGSLIRNMKTLEFSLDKLWSEFVCIPGPGAVISRAVIRDKLRPAKFRYIDDYCQWLDLSINSKFKRVPSLLASWRQHQSQLSSRMQEQIQIEQLRLVTELEFLFPEIPPTVNRQKMESWLKLTLLLNNKEFSYEDLGLFRRLPAKYWFEFLFRNINHVLARIIKGIQK